MNNSPKQNTDKLLYKEPIKDWKEQGYEPKVFVTKDGGIGMSYFGKVIVKSIKQWIEDNMLGKKSLPKLSEEKLNKALKQIQWKDFIPTNGVRGKHRYITLHNNARKRIAKTIINNVERIVE